MCRYAVVREVVAALVPFGAFVGVVLLTINVLPLLPDEPITWPGAAFMVAMVMMCVLVVRMSRSAGRWERFLRRRAEAPVGLAADVRARHEAAHAVVAHRLGHIVESVSITPEGISGGRVVWRHRDGAICSVDHMTISYAGPLADGAGVTFVGTRDVEDDASLLLRQAVAVSSIDDRDLTPSQALDLAVTEARRLVDVADREIDCVAAALIERPTLTRCQFLAVIDPQ